MSEHLPYEEEGIETVEGWNLSVLLSLFKLCCKKKLRAFSKPRLLYSISAKLILMTGCFCSQSHLS